MGTLHRAVTTTALAAAAALALALPGALAADQSSGDLAGLLARVDADQAQVKVLQGQLAREKIAAGETKVAALFGESDEEKAARQQKEQAQDQSIATLNQRVNDLEETLRRLTGQMEQLDHRVSEFNDKIARMQKDFEYKLCTIAAQQLGATAAQDQQTALPCNGEQSVAPGDAGGGAAPGGPVHLAPPPGVLGTLPQGAAQGAPYPQAQNQGGSPETRSQFDAAMNLLARAQYEEARAAFRSFANTYPKDDLAPQAIYWVGDIAYVQKDFVNAAQSFAEALKKYPASPRAPESMLKLGQSLLAMNQKKEGCLALGALPGKYPGASKTVSEQALTARHSARCR